MARYVDLDLKESGAHDFVVRHRTPTLPQIVMIFVASLLLSISVTLSVTDKMALTAITIIILGSVGWYAIIQIQRYHDQLLTTEFQNALFASALGLNNRFCLIIKPDGTIVYFDRSFQEIFPDFYKQSRRTIDAMLEMGKVKREERDEIYRAIGKSVFEKVMFEIQTVDSRFLKIVMMVEPIVRPTGFILLRCREFVEKRTPSKIPSALRDTTLMNKPTIALFSHVMDTMQMGVYMTGPTGQMVYTNPLLENWLGYDEGEITGKNLSIADLIHHSDSPTGPIEPEDFEGEILLQKKIGTIMRAFINQKALRDEQGRLMGSTAIVHHFVEQDGEKKKKLW